MGKAANLSPSLAGMKLVGEDNLTEPMARTAGYEDDGSNTELYKLWHYKDEKVGP